MAPSVEVKESVSGCDVIGDITRHKKNNTHFYPQCIPNASIRLLTRTADGVGDLGRADLVRDKNAGARGVIADCAQGVEVCHVTKLCGVAS